MRTSNVVAYAPVPLTAPDSGEVYNGLEPQAAASDGQAFAVPATPAASISFDAALLPTPPEVSAGTLPPAYVVMAQNAKDRGRATHVIAHAHCGRGATRSEALAAVLVPGHGLQLLRVHTAHRDAEPVRVTKLGTPTLGACQAISAGTMACDAAAARAVFACVSAGRPRDAAPHAVHVDTTTGHVLRIVHLHRASRGANALPLSSSSRWPVSLALPSDDPRMLYGIFLAAQPPLPTRSAYRPRAHGSHLLLEAARVDDTNTYVALTPVRKDHAHAWLWRSRNTR